MAATDLFTGDYRVLDTQEPHPYRVEIGAVGRQEEEMRADITDRVTGRLAFMARGKTRS